MADWNSKIIEEFRTNEGTTRQIPVIILEPAG